MPGAGHDMVAHRRQVRWPYGTDPAAGAPKSAPQLGSPSPKWSVESRDQPLASCALVDHTHARKPRSCWIDRAGDAFPCACACACSTQDPHRGRRSGAGGYEDSLFESQVSQHTPGHARPTRNPLPTGRRTAGIALLPPVTRPQGAPSERATTASTAPCSGSLGRHRLPDRRRSPRRRLADRVKVGSW